MTAPSSGIPDLTARGNVSITGSEEKSSFDKFLEEKWTSSPTWYPLGDLRTARLDGRWGFWKQLNPKRSEHRRTPEDIQDIRQPFDKGRFNFTRVNEDEVLLRIDGDAVITNVAPLEYCHSLVVPSVEKCLPQVLTREGLELTLKLMFASSSPDLRGGFNSLGGFASVNHQHLHIYYFRQRLLLETLAVQSLTPDIFTSTEWPAKCLLFFVTQTDWSSLEKFFEVVKLLLDNNISHNVFLTRGSIPGACYFAKPTCYEGIRIYLWARENSFGVKCTKDFSVALVELSGQVPIRTEDVYETVTETIIADRLREYCDGPYRRMMELLELNKII